MSSGTIRGIGVDIADPARLEALCRARGPAFLARWFLPAELEACGLDGHGLPLPGTRDPWLRLAALFAAKEAALKALDASLYRDHEPLAHTGSAPAEPWTGPVRLGDFSLEEPFGPRPRLLASGRSAEQAAERGVARFTVSLSRRVSMGMAIVLAEGECS